MTPLFLGKSFQPYRYYLVITLSRTIQRPNVKSGPFQTHNSVFLLGPIKGEISLYCSAKVTCESKRVKKDEMTESAPFLKQVHLGRLLRESVGASQPR